jgi:hypothetical protein
MYYNNDRLDTNLCCGIIYKTIVTEIDLVAYELNRSYTCSLRINAMVLSGGANVR